MPVKIQMNRPIRASKDCMSVHPTEGSQLPITKQLQPIRTSHLIFCAKNPNSGRHVFFTTYSIATEQQTGWPRTKPSKWVRTHIHRWRTGISYNQRKQMTLIWMLDLNQLTMPSTSQHSTAWRSYQKLVRKEAGPRVHHGSLYHCQLGRAEVSVCSRSQVRGYV